ncbi:MAG: Ni/Fe-hydrogenase cytochrome b subunit [Candidatus Electryoneaceae bacterium]|nr:Ni/Fe-hydrogenase cytochrome b subunit [Candidatus Electryoneaceae bacterium]
MNRVRNFKLILWILTGLAAAVGTMRYIYGLGATTNLTDATPWGLWIGFDVMSGVALAAGGFVIAATVYIFKLDKFHGIVRPAVLTALLGYIAVAVGLLFDLGLPWNIWHMIIYWNPHSPLFEVGWCVMLYLAVLLLEFLPVPAEEFVFLTKIRSLLIKLRMPLVIAGIALSTLHQSSLGSLFLINPYHLHPLWYSPILPVVFFISAIALGLMMVTFESSFTAWLYRRKPETDLLAKLGNAAQWIFLTYLLVRLGDLMVRGQLGHLGDGTWYVKMFWVELMISAFIPIFLLSIPKVRNSHAWQMTISIMAVTGIVLNRINVGGMAHINRGESLYLPAWTEIAVSAGVVSLAALAFLFMVEKFKVWEERPVDPDADPAKLPEFGKVDNTCLGVPLIAARTKYTLGFIIAAAFGFAMLSGEPAESRGVDPAPVQKARGGDTLWIDGNMDGYGSIFKHKFHEDILGGEASCAKCHHMNLPHDQNTGCYSCHSDMYQPTDAFGHDWHASPDGGKLSCVKCHTEGESRSAEASSVRQSIRNCSECHNDMIPAGAEIDVNSHMALSYTDGMHQMCIGCHSDVIQNPSLFGLMGSEISLAEDSVETVQDVDRTELARCTNCHRKQP